MDLKKYLLIPFSDPKISNGELKQFTEDHLGRLRKQNLEGSLAGKLTGLIAATEPLYGTFVESLSSRETSGAVREGDTMAMTTAMKAFKDLVRRRASRVEDKFGKPSPQYEEFFPGGLTRYGAANLENVETMMTHMVTTSTKYQVQVGVDMVNEFTAAKAAFLAARGSQSDQKGEVADAIRARENARGALEVQLTKNLLFFAGEFLGQPERLADVMDQSILKEAVSAEPPPAPTPPAPTPGP